MESSLRDFSSEYASAISLTLSICAFSASVRLTVASAASFELPARTKSPAASPATAATAIPTGEAACAMLNSFCAAVAPSTAILSVLKVSTAFMMPATKESSFVATKVLIKTVPIDLMTVMMSSPWFMIFMNRLTRLSTPLPIFCPTLSQSMSFSLSEIASRAFLIESDAFSYTVIILPSIFDFRSVRAPPTLSFMVSAMPLAAPAELLTASVSLFTSSGAAFTIARRPLMASWPAIAFALAVCCVSDIPENAFLRSFMTSFMDFIFPSESVREIPSSSMASAHSFGGADSLVRIDRNAVPDFSPLMPAFAIRPIATAASSMFIPSAPMIGAAYWNVCPIISTFVFALDEAAAITSASRPASSAPYPIAVNASVTMSDVVARSEPEAAARFMMPSMPESISSVFQPAIAM